MMHRLAKLLKRVQKALATVAAKISRALIVPGSRRRKAAVPPLDASTSGSKSAQLQVVEYREPLSVTFSRRVQQNREARDAACRIALRRSVRAQRAANRMSTRAQLQGSLAIRHVEAIADKGVVRIALSYAEPLTLPAVIGLHHSLLGWALESDCQARCTSIDTLAGIAIYECPFPIAASERPTMIELAPFVDLPAALGGRQWLTQGIGQNYVIEMRA